MTAERLSRMDRAALVFVLDCLRHAHRDRSVHIETKVDFAIAASHDAQTMLSVVGIEELRAAYIGAGGSWRTVRLANVRLALLLRAILRADGRRASVAPSYRCRARMA